MNPKPTAEERVEIARMVDQAHIDVQPLRPIEVRWRCRKNGQPVVELPEAEFDEIVRRAQELPGACAKLKRAERDRDTALWILAGFLGCAAAVLFWSAR